MTPPPTGSGPHALKTVLPNGVRVVTERLDHVDSVSLGIWTDTGSRNDPPGQEGITHFVEHMLFKGTTTRSTLQIAEAIDDIGGHVNGVTDREGMCIYAATGVEQCEAAVRLLFDLLLHSVLSEEDVSREREVVLQEIGHVQDAAEDWMHELVPQTAWADHALGRALMGTEASVGGVGCEPLRGYLASEVQAADRLLVTAAGQVEHGLVVELAAELAGDMKRGAPPQETAPPTFHAERRLIRQAGSQIHFCLASPGVSRTDASRHAFAVLDTVLGGGNSSRLFQEIRENRGLSYGIGSYLESYREGGLFVVAAGVSPKKFDLVLDLIDREVARLRKEGVGQEELARAKVQLKVALALAAESTGFRMQHLAASESCWGRVLPFDEIAAGVDRVTAEDVHGIAQGVLREGERALVAIGPFDEDGRTR
jgi:predicted Zn-dependent peptidase